MPKITELTELTAPVVGDLLVVIDDPLGTPITKKITIQNLLKTLGLVLPAGSTSLAPLGFTSGTNLTTPVAGAVEYDGASFYNTVDTTSGRAHAVNMHLFRLAADGSAVGPAIADFFGANSAFPTVASALYLLEYHLYFLKTTSNTVTWTLTNTETYTSLSGFYTVSTASGIANNDSTKGAGIQNVTTAAAAFPATVSLTSTATHHVVLRALAEIGTAGNIRLRVTSASGTVTPLRGSYYTARRLPTSNVGTFVA